MSAHSFQFSGSLSGQIGYVQTGCGTSDPSGIGEGFAYRKQHSKMSAMSILTFTGSSAVHSNTTSASAVNEGNTKS